MAEGGGQDENGVEIDSRGSRTRVFGLIPAARNTTSMMHASAVVMIGVFQAAGWKGVQRPVNSSCSPVLVGARLATAPAALHGRRFGATRGRRG